MVVPTSVTVKWDRVSGSTSYVILRDGVKVASTRTAVTAKLGVQPGGHVWVVVAQPGGQEQQLDMKYDLPPSP